jgi:GGDEF domain-containing protein
MAFPMTGSTNDDPRKLRSLIDRAADLARDHSVHSVMVGLAAPEGDLLFPEFVEFLRSALRVEDAIFRMTRERAVLHLADIDREQAREVLTRLVSDYSEEFPAQGAPDFQMRIYDVTPGIADDLSVKSVLKVVFAGEPSPLLH